MGWMMRGDMLHYLSELTAREAAGFGHPKAQRCHSEREAAVRWIRQTIPATIYQFKTGNAHQRASLSQARDVFSSPIRIERVS
jgi:hypothetical protein